MRNKEIFCSFIVLTRWILVLLAKIKKTTEDFEEEKKRFPLWRDVECNFTDFIQPRSVSYITISHPTPRPLFPRLHGPNTHHAFFFFPCNHGMN